MRLKACIILFIASILKTQSTPPSHIPFCKGDVCYIRVESSSGRDWTEAQKACRSYSSTLPIVDDSTHQISFEAAARCLTTEEERKLGIWIGAKASYSNPNNWTWLNGSNYTGTEVQSQEGYGKVYAFLQDTSSGESLRAQASYPTESFYYICHYPPRADLCKNGIGLTVENGCFVLSDKRMSWFSARNACLTNDGDLASFKNISLLEGRIGTDAVWVGLRSSQWNWQRAGTAVTDSSSDVTFTLWNSGQPDDNAPTCISTDEDEKFPNWRDYSCSQSLPFICQYTTSPPFNLSLAICPTPSTTTRKHIDAASSSLSSSTTGKSSATIPSVSPTITSFSPKEVRQKNDTDSVDTIAVAVGIGVGVGVPVILALIVVVIVISVRRKRRNRVPVHEKPVFLATSFRNNTLCGDESVSNGPRNNISSAQSAQNDRLYEGLDGSQRNTDAAYEVLDMQ